MNYFFKYEKMQYIIYLPCLAATPSSNIIINVTMWFSTIISNNITIWCPWKMIDIWKKNSLFFATLQKWKKLEKKLSFILCHYLSNSTFVYTIHIAYICILLCYNMRVPADEFVDFLIALSYHFLCNFQLSYIAYIIDH